MKKVILRGWRTGLKKVSLTLFFRHKLGYSLTMAKAATDAVLDDKQVEIEVPDEGLEVTLAELADIGVEFVTLDDRNKRNCRKG